MGDGAPRGGFDTFLAEPVETYIRPVLDDIAARSEAARAQAPRELAAALGHRYTIEGVVGSGGMATVYLAQDQSFGRAVAVKVLHAALADSLGAERFTREIELTARLEHSRIVPVHERGSAASLLYFVMRYFDGGSLRHQLDRDGKLPLPVAIALARDVASALDHAHGRGVVHRDIKPENILLEGSNAFVADFGIARLVDAAGVDRLTRTGVVVGTPEYMSPEQADPEAPIDGRSDVYSLGCVLYEMLAGEPPYTGPTRRDVLAKHAAAAIPDLTIVRGTVTAGMQRAIRTALQKAAADRYWTCGEFIREFETAVHEAPVPMPSRWAPGWASPRVVRVAAASLAAASVISMAGWAEATQGTISGMFVPTDTSSVAIFPFSYDSSFSGRIPERQLVGDAFRRWRNRAVVDEVRLTEMLARRNPASIPAKAPSIARQLGAGLFVRGEVSRIGDSVRLHAALYYSRGNRFVRDATVRMGGDLAALDSATSDLVTQLLFATPDREVRWQCQETTRPDAYRACAFAREAISKWDLASAETALAVADTLDEKFGYVQLWLAQVRSWQDKGVATWASVAEAASDDADLDVLEHIRANALAALGKGQVLESCQLWRDLVARAPKDYSAWYGLGACLRADGVVVRDRRSVSGWRFRSSHYRALSAYKRAFELRPSMLILFKDQVFTRARVTFMTATGALRGGKSEGEASQQFLARATWDSKGDSLVLVPFPIDLVRNADSVTWLPTIALAAEKQRHVFAGLAESWVRPDSISVALEAHATALEMLDHADAPKMLRRARDRATTAKDSLRISVHEVWLQLKRAIPGDTARVRAARRTADSLLEQRGTMEEVPVELAGLAALTGRALVAAELIEESGDIARGNRTSLAQAGRALLTFAAMGAPSDTLRQLEQQVFALIQRSNPATRDRDWQSWLARPLTMTFPDIPPSAAYLRASNDPLLTAQRDLLLGSDLKAQDFVATMRRGRKVVDPAELAFDAVYAEASLLVQMGDHAGAIDWLDAVLSALPSHRMLSASRVAGSGAFVRAMALRAELAARTGDVQGAMRWANIVSILWSDADKFLKPLFTAVPH